ncbi:hypothetical protein UFOVP587_47 [uncultured Caudovirales phage]|uniref:Uncharacterized protein n=1 Tax=uncultured Caudovirales phage TaxID=2100421 RepID=A0A6J5N1P8_9CAUD|nr:hypothetical protein UFOVP587_47 [uncultured Caudovirales phage]
MANQNLQRVVWETVAHELAHVIFQLEEKPTDIKVWKKVWKALAVYEGVCRHD